MTNAQTAEEMTSGELRSAQLMREFKQSVLRRKILVNALRLAFGLLFVGFWEYASGRLIDPFFVSSPIAVVIKIFDWIGSGYLYYHLSNTLFAAFLGFVVGGIFGFILGILLGRMPLLSEVISPYITAIYSIPKIVLAPLFIIWFGIGIESKIVLSATIVFFIIFMNTFSGARDVNPIYIHSAQIMGGSPWNVISAVIMPSATIWVITGLKLSVPYALVGVVVGEFMSSNRGIGFIIAEGMGLFDTNSVFAGIIVLSIVGALVNNAIYTLELWLLRWKE